MLKLPLVIVETMFYNYQAFGKYTTGTRKES